MCKWILNMGCVITKRENKENYVPRCLPEVSIYTGTNVSGKLKDEHDEGLDLENGENERRKIKIVFVFGGPGSRKGRVVNDLAQGYGFHVISAEKLILNHLPEKLGEDEAIAETLDSTKELEQLLQRKPDLLTLQWVLEMIDKELQQAQLDGHEYYLIDVVPNLRAMLQVQTFIKDCEQEMEDFEKEWPCLFALNLAVPEKKVIENVTSAVAKNPDHLQKRGQSDEKDVMKTKRRYDEYSYSVKDFLKYFNTTDRLVTVDVSCGIADLIWSKVSEFFFSVGFVPKMAINTVIVFAFKGEDLAALDLKKYRMELIVANCLIEDDDVDIEEIFIAINEQIEKSKVTVESFAVDLQDSRIFEQLLNREGRQILFLDQAENHLHHYIYVGATKTDRSKSLFNLPFKAVCSTENEICLFPEELDIGFCKQVALLYAETKIILKKRKCFSEENKWL
ncbi:uncharacterized protein LOC143249585 isoform X1 [Tachypleus tridentatus]|uniref:uncharacterized protein LOC143249585 isoform X1 n=1 Tax=Tachypleus tridentatus TaxID=6853 RepID=UPI003FD1B4FD